MSYPARILSFTAFLIVLLALFGLWFFRCALRSYVVLERYIDPQATGPLLNLATHNITSENVAIPLDSGGAAPARLYLPEGVAHPHGIVVVPGIHYLGIDEPRFAHFSQAMAEVGFAVLTPQIASLADYHIGPDAIETIGD